MLDVEHNVTRIIRVFSKTTEQVVAEIELTKFDLFAFQRVFGVRDRDNPMFECYEVTPEVAGFFEAYLSTHPEWRFNDYSYFLEADAV
jgi:hypothetical protein